MAISNRIFDNREKSPRLVVMISADRKLDRRILLEADSLERAGWRVVIVGMPLDPGEVDTDPRVVRAGSGLYPSPGVKSTLYAYRWLRRLLPMNSQLMRAFKAFAWKFWVDQESFFTNLFSDTVSQFSPQVYVAHDLPTLAVAREAARRSRAKLAYDSHELYCEQEFSNREKQRWKKIEAKHIGACDAVITINPSIAAELERRYNILGVHVIYNAERTEFNHKGKRFFHKTFKIPVDHKILLFQGGLSAGRNIECLVAGMAYVRNPTINLVIMGDGTLRAAMVKKIRELRLSERVHLHPAVPQDQLLSVTANADAGVIPYQATCLNNYYCTPNKLFEYIAAGLPILANDLPEISNLVKRHDIGMVSDLSTAEKTARSIDDFFSDSGRLKRWRKELEHTRKIVCWEREAEKLVSIFDSLK